MLPNPSGDTVVDFANREFKNLLGTEVPLKLLDEKQSTICGIRVDLNNYINDLDVRQQIEDKLTGIKVNVKYVQVRPDLDERKYYKN